LTKELELTPKQREQIRPLLVEHHDRIQALLDKNATLSRQALQPQIHAISDQTHHEIEALLTQVADCSGPFTHLSDKWNLTVSPEVLIWEVSPRQSLGFLPSGGQYTSKVPRKSGSIRTSKATSLPACRAGRLLAATSAASA
jgi:hypothetical protein